MIQCTCLVVSGSLAYFDLISNIEGNRFISFNLKDENSFLVMVTGL